MTDLPTGSRPQREHLWSRGNEPTRRKLVPSKAVHDHIEHKNLETRRFQSGHYIFRERETGDLAFIIQTGTVDLVKGKADGEVLVDRLGPGAIFGEFALIDGGTRLVSARAVGDDVRVAVITRDMFHHKIDVADPFVRGLLQVLTSNVRMLVDKLT